ncbi:MAG: class I SAM-dependent methyltransferase [Candidatus Omnitrophica bacterium]|nr:class I SAM-dependent methyltransferase [Candidatus Omnitrophota bacterium]
MDAGLFSALRKLNEMRNYHRWLFDQFRGQVRGDVVDIGSGWGDVVQFYGAPDVRRVVATDISTDMLAILRERFAQNPVFSVQACDISSSEDVTRVGEGLFDTVSSVNVLEHLPDDVAALANMRKLLKPGGRICLLVPALEWLYGSLDRLVGHERRYSRRNMLPKLARAGFEHGEIRYMNMPGVLTWFIAGRVLMRREFPYRSSLALDRIVPLIQGMENVFHPPFGQSLVVTAQRKG